MANGHNHQVQQPNVERSSAASPQVSPSPTPLSTLLQETKVYSSNSAPLSSPLSGPSPGPTVLPGQMTSILSDHSLIESMGSSTSSLETASPTVALNNSATNQNTTPIIVGSILAAILAVALIIAVVTWFLRVRSRRRSQDELSWDPEPNSSHSHDDNSSFVSPSSFLATQERVIPPVRPQPPNPVIRLQPDSVEQPAMQFSYPHLATPELAYTAGPLTVTNLMPGDVPLSTATSIFMESRPGSAQVTPQIDHSAPRFTRLHGGGLPVPWSRGAPEPTKWSSSRPRAWPSRLSAASLRNVFSSAAPKSIPIEPPQPRTSAANMRTYFKLSSDSNVQLPEPVRTADQTWPGTIRTGITNAWSAVIGTAVRPHQTPENNLTPIPPRPNRRLSSKTGITTLGSMSTTSTQSVVGYPMEEKSHSRPITRGFSYLPSPFDEAIKEEAESYTDSLTLAGSSTLKSTPAHTVVMEQASVHQIPRVADDIVGRPSSVPRLPTIRPLSRAWTLRSEGFVTLPESDDGYRSAFDQMINERKQEYDRRLAELEAVAADEASRPVMSRASTTSLMTESTALSRQSSFMGDEEMRVKKVLRMRRKRAMALSSSAIGNGKVSGS